MDSLQQLEMWMDDADAAQTEIENALSLRIASARGEIRIGVSGECEACGEVSKRLIDGECARCRDRAAKYKLLRGIHE